MEFLSTPALQPEWFEYLSKIVCPYWYEPIPAPKSPREAAVGVWFREQGGQSEILLIERARVPGDPHSGQVAFPGGMKEVTDLDLRQTAVRESYEELGVSRARFEVWGQIPATYTFSSNILMTPVLGTLSGEDAFRLQLAEVAHAFWLPLNSLLDGALDEQVPLRRAGVDFLTPAIRFNRYLIWGATAGVLINIRDRIRIMQSSNI